MSKWEDEVVRGVNEYFSEWIVNNVVRDKVIREVERCRENKVPFAGVMQNVRQMLRDDCGFIDIPFNCKYRRIK